MRKEWVNWTSVCYKQVVQIEKLKKGAEAAVSIQKESVAISTATACLQQLCVNARVVAKVLKIGNAESQRTCY